MLNSVVIGWNPEENIEKWDQFAHALERVFLSVKTDSFETDKDHIYYAYTVDEISELIDRCSILVCPEDLNGLSVGNGTLKKWMGMASCPLRIVLVIDDSRKGGGKCRGLYDNGCYDALFLSDFSIKALYNLVHHGRSRGEAFTYYCLDEYQAEERKKAVKDGEDGEIPGKRSEKAIQGTLKSVGSDLSAGNGPTPEVIRAEELISGNDSGTGENPAEPVPPVKKKRRRRRKRKGNTETVLPEAESAVDISERVAQSDGNSTGILIEDRKGYGRLSGVPGGLDIPSDVASVGAPDTESSVTGTAQEPIHPGGNAEAFNDIIRDYGEDGKFAEYGDDVAYPPEQAGDPAINEKLPDVFSASDEEIDAFLVECDEISHSYVKPEIVLSKTDRVIEELLVYYTVDNPSWLNNLQDGTMSREEFESELWQRIGMYSDDLNAEEARVIFENFSRFMWRYDIIEPYILDEEVQDIKIYEPQVIMISSNGENMLAPAMFRSEIHYRNFVMRLATRNHVKIQKNAINRFTDKTSYDEARLRVNISTELINSSGLPLVHIRKVNNIKFTVAELIEKKMLTPRTAAYVIKRIKEGASVLVCGENASGKTTFLNTFIEYLSLTVPGLFIQESDEVFSDTHPLLQFQQIASDKEFMGDDTVGKKYTLAELAKNGLLTKIEFFGIGEMKGEETAYAHTAIDTGSQFFGTTHTSSSKAALMRLVRLAMMSKDMRAFSKEDLLQSFCQINLIVFMKKFQIVELTEVVGFNETEGVPVYREVPIVIPEKTERDIEHLKTYEEKNLKVMEKPAMGEQMNAFLDQYSS